MKIENILKKCAERWTEPHKPLIQKIASTPKDWNMYDTMRCTIEWAKEQGINVIPIKRRTKVPAIPSWKEYQKRKTTYKEIEQWFFSDLTESSFVLQFCTFMAHYLRRKLKEIWYDSEKEEWTDETTGILHKEPWCYREWYKIFPDTSEEFYDMLTSKHFNEFLKEHITKKHTWGWTKIFSKQDPNNLFSLHIMLLQAQQNADQYREALKTCQNLLGEVKEFWLKGYPKQLRTQAKDDITIGDIAFTWLVTNENSNRKLTALDIASFLKMNVMTCRRTVMPNIKKLEPLLKLFGVEIARRGEG